jgi:hypothetical protein
MLYGEAAQHVSERSVWASAPLAAALALLVMTGLAWPPGLAAALDGIAAVIAP